MSHESTFFLSELKTTNTPGIEEDLGCVDYDQFLVKFESMDWPTESRRAFWAKNNLPGLSVRNTVSGDRLWVMSCDLASRAWPGGIFPDGFGLTFVIGMNTVDTVENAYSSPNVSEIRMLFKAFFDSDLVLLQQELQRLQPVEIVE